MSIEIREKDGVFSRVTEIAHHGITAEKLRPGVWKVTVAALALGDLDALRDDLDDELFDVDGVDEVDEQGRDVWLVFGSPKGPDLITTVAGLIDQHADAVAAAVA